MVRYRRSIAAYTATGVYLVLQMLWILAIDRSISYGSDLWAVFVFTVIGLASLALGLATGWWASPALPFVTVILAIPLGLPGGNHHEPLPIWFGILLLAPVEALLIALAVAGRTLWDRRPKTGTA
jgi:hypothetical protein